MPTIYDLKPKFQNLLRPICDALAKAGITANQITIYAAVLSALGGLAILLYPTARWPLLVLPVVLFVRMALNAIDGMLAREHNMKSPLGAILNELGDVLADAALYLPLALVPGVPGALVVTLVIIAIVTEMAGVVAVQIGASRRYDGPFGKSDRALLFGLLALLLGVGVPIGHWVASLLGICIVLGMLTIWKRSKNALKEGCAS
ncbi:MAG: CDP-alcohol phosphatidyltransferase family protein [Verrucomicrobia bacterium]|nr:CDP-alcohol phosphatidyltransferase family protein [Verrucomicrobiota bacterium]